MRPLGLLLVTFALLGAACGTAVDNAGPTSTHSPPATTATAAAGQSGIEGQILLGPTCPVQRIDSPCPDRPYEATIDVLDRSGVPVTSFRSGNDGRYRVPLPPGTYTLAPRSTAYPHGRPETVDVPPGEFAHIIITFDTGIR